MAEAMTRVDTYLEPLILIGLERFPPLHLAHDMGIANTRRRLAEGVGGIIRHA